MTKTKMLLAAIALLTIAATLGGMVHVGMVIILRAVGTKTHLTGLDLVAIGTHMVLPICVGTIRALTQYEYTT